MVYRKKTDAGTTLTCYAYSFYPREIEVKWVRNGLELPWTSKQILPNPDGTYQVKTTVEVHEGDDEKTYSCRVDHSSLEEAKTVVYEDRSPPTEISGPVVWEIVFLMAVLLVLLFAIGVGINNCMKICGEDRSPPTEISGPVWMIVIVVVVLLVLLFAIGVWIINCMKICGEDRSPPTAISGPVVRMSVIVVVVLLVLLFAIGVGIINCMKICGGNKADQEGRRGNMAYQEGRRGY